MTDLKETIRRVRKAVDDRPSAVQATLNIDTVKILLDAAEKADLYEKAMKQAQSAPYACFYNWRFSKVRL